MSVGVIGLLAVSFNGCATDGMAINTVGGNKVDRYFHHGYIASQKKCVIDDRELAVLTGAGVGAVGGAVAGGGDLKGGAIGAVVGGLIGAVVGKEVIAYETTIKAKDGKIYKGYLQQKLPVHTNVEFTIKNSKLKNVNVTGGTTKIKRTTIKRVVKKSAIADNSIISETLVDVIDKRYKRGGVWYYHLRKNNQIIYSSKKYYYLDDKVKVSLDDNHKIIKIKRLKAGVIKPAKKVVTVKKPVIKKAVKPMPVTKKPTVKKPVEPVVETVEEKKPVVKKAVEPMQVKPVVKKAEVKKPVATKKANDSIW